MAGRLDKFYKRLPILAQHAAVSGYGCYWYWLRFGRGYKRYVREYVEREQFTAEDWRIWQKRQVCQVLAAAATQVPFYQRTWNKQDKLAALSGELENLPLLSKQSVRVEPEAFRRNDIRPGFSRRFPTSGSTGTPILSIWTIQELRKSLAVREARSARWAGVSFRMPRATFSGRMVEPACYSNGPFYRFNLIESQAYLSAFHLSSKTASAYVNALNKHRIQWLTGYAFSYYSLARFMLDQGLKISSLKAVITTSEKLTPEMRIVMEKAYGCRVYEEYSTVENNVFASECQAGRLHVSPDVSVLEILRSNGKPCLPGEVGEVVVTDLMRSYQPLIRYRLGDMAQWDADPCSCGRSMPVLKEITGRIEDAVIGPDGREMVRFHGIFVGQRNVREGQIIQETQTRIRVRLVPSNGFGSADVEDITHRIHQRLGPKVEVVVDSVDDIPRTKAGKFRAVVSLLNTKTEL